jgi:hypothetical protein
MRLEKMARGGLRMVVCRVRDGHEAADESEALADAGLSADTLGILVAIRMFAAGPDFRPHVLGTMDLK